MMYEDVIRDFASRTRQNLKVIEEACNQGHKVFETTQLINSMLGLLVFPQQEYLNAIPKTPLEDLERDGWPIPKVTRGFKQVGNLNDLIRYLRNAVAHFNIKFIGDGQQEISVLRVWNTRSKRGRDGKLIKDSNGNNVEEKNWEAELSLNYLRGITDRFIDILLEYRPAHPSKVK